MGYTMELYLLCVGAALGLGTLLFVSSLLVMLAREGFAYVFRALRRVPSPMLQVRSSFGRRDLEGTPSLVVAQRAVVAGE
jgi:hypothetical protein